jgi:hypothetical protein
MHPVLLSRQGSSSVACRALCSPSFAPVWLPYSVKRGLTACTCRCQRKEESLPSVVESREASLEKIPSLSTPAKDPAAPSTALYSFAAPLIISALSSADAPAGGYSQASYYTTLGLFVLSAPGLWSLIKRSTKSKVSPSICVLGCDFRFASRVSRSTSDCLIKV